MIDSKQDTPEDEPEVISYYSDAQAQDDGVLIALPHRGSCNRVTAAVWADYADERFKKIGLTDITPLTALWDKVQAVPEDDGWHVANLDGKTFWMIPNEVGGLTLMYPEDY